MKVLIGYDGSESADAALDGLKLAGLPRDSEVLVVSVADLLMSEPPIVDVAEQVFTSRRMAAALERAHRSRPPPPRSSHACAALSGDG